MRGEINKQPYYQQSLKTDKSRIELFLGRIRFLGCLFPPVIWADNLLTHFVQIFATCTVNKILQWEFCSNTAEESYLRGNMDVLVDLYICRLKSSTRFSFTNTMLTSTGAHPHELQQNYQQWNTSAIRATTRYKIALHAINNVYPSTLMKEF
jgi:hypothetical protein